MNDLISRQKLLADMKRKCVGNCLKCQDYTILSSDYHCGLIDEQPQVEQMVQKQSITSILQQIAENICDNYCKYRDTCDEDAMCDITRNGGECPLDMLV